MKNLVHAIIASALVLAAIALTSPEVYGMTDSLELQKLNRKLEEYLKALERESIETKCAEADFLIEACQDSIVRQFTALKIYTHFINSKVMGDEGVAIGIFDNWFASGKIKMKSELDLMNARIYSEFNRSSLIGEKAPELTMENIDGETLNLFSHNPGKYSILFFYDTDCPKCRIESILLRNLLKSKDYPVDFYAIYTQSDREKWTNYVNNEFTLNGCTQINVQHLWDPEIASNFQIKYGILQTPKLFLVSDTGIITGRNLDCQSLEILLDRQFTRKDQYSDLSYGSEESARFYDTLFSGQTQDCESIISLCSHISGRTLGQKDTLLFRQMTGDLMYYLGGKRGEGTKCALKSLLDNQIFGKPEIWKTPSDSLKIISFAKILKDLQDKSQLGGTLPEVLVDGILKRGKSEKECSISLRKLRNCTVIFMTNSCNICKKEVEVADSLSKSSTKEKFFIVNVDEILAYKPETAKILFDNFDLSALPYITKTDKKGRIARKYMSLSIPGKTSDSQGS